MLTAAVYGTIAADVHVGRTMLVIDVTGTRSVAVGYERFLWRRGALLVSVA